MTFDHARPERQALAAELAMALDAARTRTGFRSLTVLLGNEIRVCLYYISMDIRRWHRVGETFKLFGPDEMELAIVFVNGFGRR